MKILSIVVLVCAAGCTATRNARLYDLQSADLLIATYKMNGSGHGPIWIGTTQQTADCKGEYVTVASGSTGWGAIYGAGGPTVVTTSRTDDEQRGRAIVTCSDGRIIECEYVTGSTAGHGSCQDNQSRRYRVMF
jgi:hypothetical protein